DLHGDAGRVDHPRQDVPAEFIGAQTERTVGRLKFDGDIDVVGRIRRDHVGEDRREDHQSYEAAADQQQAESPPVNGAATHPVALALRQLHAHARDLACTCRGSRTAATKSTTMLAARTTTVTVRALASSTG